MDKVLIGDLVDWLAPLLLAMVATLAVLIILNWLQQYYLFRMSQKLYITGSARFFWHVLHLPIAFFNLRFAGDLAGRASLNGNIAELLSGQLASSGLAVITILFYAVVMLQYIVPLTLLGIAFAAVNLVALRAISRKRVDASHRLAQETGKLVSTSYSGLQMIETLKATGTDSDFPARWAGYQAKALNAQEELAVYTAFLMGMPTLLAATSTAVVLSIGGERVIAGSLSIGSLIAFQALMVSFSTPVTGLVNLAGSAQEAAADMSRLDDVLRHPLDSSVQAYARPEAGQEARRLEGELELRDLTFGYSRR
ncbi:MAG TPA: ABC transporter transmembrane domain-containing protein [Chloroflexota bacterium]|nr:ABC transporter transmembrane domain-containing protein [Chloroflexota bacterium]